MTTETDSMTEEDQPVLPGLGDLGRYKLWRLPLQDGKITKFEGYFVGLSSSRRDFHENHNGAPYGTVNTWTTDDPDRRRCSACRWFEPRIFAHSDDEDIFAVHRLGATIVPGESIRVSYEQVGSAFELIELLTVPKGRRTVLTLPGRRVIAQAAGYDDKIRDAYLHWREME
jgi:hypothetical protein